MIINQQRYLDYLQAQEVRQLISEALGEPLESVFSEFDDAPRRNTTTVRCRFAPCCRVLLCILELSQNDFPADCRQHVRPFFMVKGEHDWVIRGHLSKPVVYHQFLH